MTATVLTIAIEPADRQRLAELARVTGRSEEEVAAEAIHGLLELNDWQVAAIQEGLDSVNRGEVISGDAVKAWIESWGSTDELPPPQPPRG